MNRKFIIAGAAALFALSACEKEIKSEPVVVVDEPCEDSGACEPTD